MRGVPRARLAHSRAAAALIGSAPSLRDVRCHDDEQAQSRYKNCKTRKESKTVAQRRRGQQAQLRRCRRHTP